jgi:predicted dehydrogenase
VKSTLRWGIIGTGAIASDFATALKGSSRCRIVDVTGSAPEKARAFGERWDIASHAPTLRQFLANDEVEAVYIATPHPLHEEQALACIEAGKAVLCEKPMTVDVASAERLIDSARRGGVFLMEAYMYRCHPLMRELARRLADGAIGTLRHVRADFGFRAAGARSGRLFDPTLGGGSILDVGGYPVSFARLVAGLVEGAPFAEPVEIHGSVSLGPTGVDELASAKLVFSSGFTAEVTSAIRHDVGTAAVVYGDAGKVVVPNPWLPRGNRHGLESEFTVFRDGRAPENVMMRTREATYAIEAAVVADTLPRMEPEWPAMTWADTLGNMRVLDRWRASSERRPDGARPATA